MFHDDASSAASTPCNSDTAAQSPSGTSDVTVNGHRAIVPTPPTSNLAPAVTAPSPNGAYNQPSRPACGPASSTYEVLPRPKPGRKPATDEPASKRKAQNRESQRQFRARKAQKLADMMVQVEAERQKHNNEISTILSENRRLSSQKDDLEKQLVKLTNERNLWKDKYRRAAARCQSYEQRLQQPSYSYNTNLSVERQPGFFDNSQESPTRASIASFSDYDSKNVGLGFADFHTNGEAAGSTDQDPASSVNPFTSAAPALHAPAGTTASRLTPQAEDDYASLETDFTSHRFLPQDGNDADSKCGFCTEDTHCVCKDPQFHGVLKGQDEVVPASDDVDKPAAIAGPGSCEDCQANPRQRAWCQRVAQLKNEELPPSPTSRNPSISSALETMEPHIPDASTPYGAKQSIGCSEAFKLFDGRVPMDQDKMDWFGRLKPLPPQERRDTVVRRSHPPKYSALELDTAGIIATLGNTLKPLRPRPSDGENADIVRMAQQFQRNTQSPRTSPDTGSLANDSMSVDTWR